MTISLKPWELVERLEQEEADGLLSLLHEEKLLHEENEFWRGAGWALDPKITFPYRFSILDPIRYGPGVPFETFSKLVLGMLEQRLTAEQSAVAISRLSERCTEEQWTNWYRRLIEQDLPEGLSVAVFNKYAPADRRISAMREYVPRLIETRQDLPESFLMEPVYPGDLTLWEINNNGSQVSVKGFYHDGSRCRNHEWEEDLRQIGNGRKLPEGLMIEAIAENGQLWLRDMITSVQFAKRTKTLPLVERRKLLDQIYERYLKSATNLELTESYTITSYKGALAQFNTLIEQGFDRVYVRPVDSTYWNGGGGTSDRIINPTGRNNLVVQALTQGGVGDKYEDAVWSLDCVQEDDRRLVHSVVLGLNNTQRRMMWKDRTAQIGRRLEVSHCGVQDDGSFLFSRIETWKE